MRIGRHFFHNPVGNRTNLTAVGTAVSAVRSESSYYDAFGRLIEGRASGSSVATNRLDYDGG